MCESFDRGMSTVLSGHLDNDVSQAVSAPFALVAATARSDQSGELVVHRLDFGCP